MHACIPWMTLATVALCFFGCGAEPEQNQRDVYQQKTEVLAPVNTLANEQERGNEEDIVEENSASTDPRGLLGKKCYADCSVVNTGAPSCPSRINGFGETTFLGGCAKACRKARGDAASKLPTGCSLGNCSTTGC